MNKKISFIMFITFLILLLTLVPNFYATSTISSENTIASVSIDGFVTIGEYENSLFLDSLNNYKLSYTVEGDEISIGIEAQARGWVALGIDPNDPATTRHRGADILMGAYLTSSSSTNFADKYGVTSSDINTDSSNDILSAAASQNNSWTTFEFNRKLATGDSRDKDITPDVGQVVMWAYHQSSDSFGEHHSSEGYTYIIFYEDTFIPPEIPEPGDGGSFNVSIDGTVTPNEYPFSIYMDSLFQFKLYYGIVNSTAYFALEVRTHGWVAIGFQPNDPTKNKHLGADIILGAFDSQSQSTVYRDDFGDASETHEQDTILGGTDDLLMVSAGEDSLFTTFEFSRNIATGDLYDQVITPETPQYIMWAYHTSIDDMNTVHSAKGYNLLTFHELDSGFDPDAPSLPFSPQQLSGSVENGQVRLNWLPPPFDGNSPISNYNVYRRLYNENLYSSIGTSSTIGFLDANVEPNLAYYYVVRAENSVGESLDSIELRVNLFTSPTDTSSNIVGQNGNGNPTSPQGTNTQEIFSEIPFGLSWALSIPLIYGAMFFALVGVIKMKRTLKRKFRKFPQIS